MKAALLVSRLVKKYKYDSKELHYREVPGRRLGVIFRVALMVGLAIVICAISFHIFDSPEKVILSKKRSEILANIEQLSSRIDTINGWLSEVQTKDEQIYRLILDKESIPKTIRAAGIGGSDFIHEIVGLNSTPLVARLVYETEVLQRKLTIQDESLNEISDGVTLRLDYLESVPAIQPVSLKQFRSISSYYGTRVDPFTKIHASHHGLDFTGDTGNKIYATGKGEIVKVKFSDTGYGNEVIIDHGYGYATRYAHLDKILVQLNEDVFRGDCIGEMGNTGRSTGTHLHYEVLYENRHQNPLLYYSTDLNLDEYEKIVKKN